MSLGMYYRMSATENKTTARRFIQELFNEGKLGEANKFVTPDIIYHGVAEEVNGLDSFKEWLAEDRKTFPDMQITILDECAEQNKVAVRWSMKATQQKGWNDLPASNEEFESNGAEIFHFKDGKIKEAWTIFDALTPALKLGIVEPVQQPPSNV
jgi:steroid delta-isomerase-like uncharacterized protein